MRSSLGIGVCVCSMALLLMGQEGGCGGTADSGGDSGGTDRGPASSSAEGKTYCEIGCRCEITAQGIAEQHLDTCVQNCGGAGGHTYDVCPAEVAAWGDCLDNNGCDIRADSCLPAVEAIMDCWTPTITPPGAGSGSGETSLAEACQSYCTNQACFERWVAPDVDTCVAWCLEIPSPDCASEFADYYGCLGDTDCDLIDCAFINMDWGRCEDER